MNPQLRVCKGCQHFVHTVGGGETIAGMYECKVGVPNPGLPNAILGIYFDRNIVYMPLPESVCPYLLEHVMKEEENRQRQEVARK